MTKKLLGRLELQVVRDSETQQRKIVFRNQNGELLDPANNPELLATLVAGGVTQADLSAALATKANASSLATKADTTAVTAAISAQHTVDNGTYASLADRVKLSNIPRRGIALAGADFNPGTLPGILGTDYSYPAAADFALVASRGYNLVRLPFRWERIQPTLSGALSTTEVAALKACVDAARANNLGVVLDVHNYAAFNGKYLGDTGTTGAPMQADFVDLWTRLSALFKDDAAVVGYGLMNEPKSMPTIGSETGNQRWQAYAQAAVTAIRALRDVTPIMVAGYASSTVAGWFNSTNGQPFPYISDPANNIYWEGHHYWDSTGGTYANSYAAENTTNSGFGGTNPTLKKALQELQSLLAWADQYDQKLFLGEFGWPYATDSTSWNTVATAWFNAVSRYGSRVWTAAWATGSRWSDSYNLQQYAKVNGQITTPNANAAVTEGYLTGRAWAPTQPKAPAGTPRPRDLSTSWKGWSSQPILGIANSTAGTTGIILVSMIVPDEDGPLNNLVVFIDSAQVAAGTTAGQCFAGIYDARGVQLGVSADISGQLATSGYRSFTMTADTVPVKAGVPIYGALLVNATTMPRLGRATTVSGALASPVNKQYGTVSGTATALPTTFSVGGLQQAAQAYWMGVSYSIA